MFFQQLKSSNIIKITFGTITLLIALIYLAFIFQNNTETIKQNFLNISSSIIIFSITLSTLGGISSSVLWFIINNKNETGHSFKLSYWAWSVGRIYRYIPGKVAGFYIRNILQKTSVKLGIISSFNEIILTIIPVLLLAIIYLLIFKGYFYYTILLSILLFALLFIKIVINIIDKLSVYKRPISDFFYSPSEILSKTPLVFLGMFLHSLALYVIVNTGLGESSFNLFYAMLTLYISGLIGQLAIISPGGIGVREAAITLILTTLGVSEDIAISTAIISRLVLLISEIVNLSISTLLKKVK